MSFISSRSFNRRGQYYKLLSDVKNGDVVQVKRGVYALEEDLVKQMIDIDKVIPGGVLCLYSAWSYYGLTTQVPQEYSIAIARGRKVVTPKFPPVALYHWSEKSYNLGIKVEKIEGFKVKIYDIEKSVCDAVKFRNKIGLDVCAEILKEYLKRSDRNIDKLMKYATQLRVANVIKNYLIMAI